MRHRGVWIAALLLALSCRSALARQGAQEIEFDPKRPYVHEPSGAVFPAAAAGLERTELLRHDEQARNLSAGYQHDDLRVDVNVQVYPTGGNDLADHFDRVMGDVERVHKGAKLIEKGPWKLVQDGVAHEGQRATFAVADRKLISEVYLLKVGEWFVKFRVSYPASSAEAAPQIIKSLQEAVRLPKP